MDYEFHYYINLLVAKLGGFDFKTSEIIAYSAQFVDDNSKRISITLDSKGKYHNTITQTANITLPSKQLKQLYSCFHFQPGAASHEKFWVTKPSSLLSNTIFTKALASKNPYMIGIASHALADTYAHQDFIGHSNVYNNPMGFTVFPNYGHMYFGELPDMIGIKWHDIRCNKTINNNVRFIKAATKLLISYSKLNLIKKSVFIENKSILCKTLINIFGKANFYMPGVEINKLKRIQKYKDIYLKLSGVSLSNYCYRKWPNEATYYCNQQKCWIALHNFENSHWFKFQEQAKIYKTIALQIINSHESYNAF